MKLNPTKIFSTCIAGVMLFAGAGALKAANTTHTATNSANWSVSTTWTPNGAPNTAGDIVTENNNGLTVTLDTAATIGSIREASSGGHSLTIASDGNYSTHYLTMDGTGITSGPNSGHSSIYTPASTGLLTVQPSLVIANSDCDFGITYDTSATSGALTVGILNSTTITATSARNLNLYNGDGHSGGSGTGITVNSSIGATGSAIAINNLTTGSYVGYYGVTINGACGPYISTITENSLTKMTINGVISGSGAAVTVTAGSLYLNNGANSYGGATTINGGTLILNAANSIPSGSSVSLTSGTLNLNGKSDNIDGLSGAGTVDATVAGTITLGIGNNNSGGTFSGVMQNTLGTLFVTKAGAGTEILSGANTYSGTTTINGGILNAGVADSAGTSGPFGKSTAVGSVVFGGGTLQYSSANQADYSGRLSTNASQNIVIDLNGQSVSYATALAGSGSTLTVSNSTGTGTLTLTAAATYSGNTTINKSAKLALSGSGALAGGSLINLAAGGSFDVSALSGTYTLGSGGLNASGTGTTVGTTAASIVPPTGGTFDFNTQPVTLTWSGASSGTDNTHPALSASSDTLNFNNNTITVVVPGTALSAGVYTLISASSISGTPSAIASYAGGNGLAAGNVGTVSVSGNSVILTVALAGTTGTWTGSGNWSTTGNWSSSPSYPHLAGDTANFGTGSSPVNLDANVSVGSLFMTNPSSYTISGANTLTLDNSSHGVAVNVSGGTANAISTAVNLNDSSDVNTINVSSGKSLSISGNITGSTAETITVSGPGTLALSGGNSYGPASSGTVGTTLSGGGTLSLGNSSALGAGDLNVSANGTIQASAAVSVGNYVNLGSGVTATVTNAGANSLTLGGIISGGSGNLTKTGNGTLTLSGANSYGGSTTVGGGTVSISADNNLGTAPGSATANSIILNGGDLLGNGTPDLNANRGVGIGPVSGATGATALVDATSGSTFIIEGNIASAGNTSTNNLTVNSGAGNNGSVILSGTNTFNGTTVIANGVLSLSNSASLQNSTLNYDNQGGALDFSTLTAATLGGLSGAQNLAMNNTSLGAVALTVGNNGSSNYYSGVLSGAGTLVKNGSGIWVLNGVNTYTNATGVSTGVLQLNSSGVIYNTAADYISANAGAELFVNGGSFTANSFNVAAPSVGLLVGSGSASILGALTMNAGNSSQASQSSLVAVTGGSLSIASFAEGRNAGGVTPQPTSGSTAIGFYVNGGNVTITNTVSICTQGGANSGNSMRIDSGSVTVGGSVTVAGGTSGSRGSVLDVTGGTLTVNDTTTGINVGGNNIGNAVLLIRGGTTTAGIIGLGLGSSVGTNVLNQTNGSLYIGAGGIVQQGATTVDSITLSGGILGATADWSSSMAITLGGSTIQCADASSTAHNITLSGFLGGTTLTKTGNGMLTLSSAGNGYTGLTTINGGTLNINSEYAVGGANYAGLTFGGSGGTVQYANPPLNAVLDITWNGTSFKPVTISAPATIDVNGNSINFAGPIGNGGSGSLTIASTAGASVVSMNGINNYTGGTAVNSGVTLGVNGTILGNVTNYGTLYPGAFVTTGATNVIGGNLVQDSSVTANTFNIGASVAAGGNDQILLTNASAVLDFGSGSAGSFTINIANGANTVLDTAHDYVLFKLTGGSASILNASRLNATPNFTGTTPIVNQSYYQIVVSGNNVVLRAVGLTPPTISSATATPNPLLANQTVKIDVVASSPDGIDPSTGVVDLSTIGGSSTQALIGNGATPTHYTNSFATANTLALGGYSLLVTVTDMSPYPYTLNNTANISLTVGTTNLTWNGAGGDNLWSSQNWASSLKPGLTGDSLTFAGSTRPTPDMEANYSITNLTFSSGAGSFDLISSSISTLTLNGNITNNSANAQTFDTSVNMGAPVTVNAASGNVTLNGVISGANTLTTSGSHTVALAGTNTFTGNMVISAGTLAISGAGQLDSTGNGSGTYTNSLTDNGNLTYSSSATNTLAGKITGTGSLTVLGTNLSLTASNSYSGGTVIYGGTLNVVGTSGASSATQSPLGSGSLTLSNGTLVCYQTSQGGIVSNNTVCVANTTNALTLNVASGKATYWAGNITGSSGELDFGGTNTASGQTSFDLAGDNSSGNSGTFKFISNVNLRLRSAASGNTPNVAWDLGNFGAQISSKVDNTPTTYYLGGLNGGTSSGLAGHASSTGGGLTTTVTYQIGALGHNDTFAGVIANGTGGGAGGTNLTALIKVGSGTLNLTGTSTYTGNTTVNAGTLEIANADIATNSTVTVAGGAFLQLDFSTTNLVKTLVLGSTSEPAGVYGNGNSGGLITGSGYLQVASSGPTGPATITNSISGSTLSLSWPAGQGWRLVSQTNSLSTGLGTTWYTVPGVSGNSATITVDPSQPTVFYELVYP